MAKRSFSPELLESLRSMVVTKALDALGLHWKRDPDFQPVKDAATIRLHVAVGGQVFELLVTGAKFFDTLKCEEPVYFDWPPARRPFSSCGLAHLRIYGSFRSAIAV